MRSLSSSAAAVSALVMLSTKVANAHDPELDRCFMGPEFERFHEAQLNLNYSMSRLFQDDADVLQHGEYLRDFLLLLDGRWACLLEDPCGGEECAADVGIPYGQHDPYTALDECIEPQSQMIEHMLESMDDMYDFAVLLGTTIKPENDFMPTILGSSDRQNLVVAWEDLANTLGDGFGLRRVYDTCLQDALWPKP